MKFEKIEDKVQLGHRGYIRHRLGKMEEGELVQKCVVCGEIINDYRLEEGFVMIKISGGDYPIGMAEGYVYVSIEKNPSTVIHEILKELGATLPTDFIDCAVQNS